MLFRSVFRDMATCDKLIFSLAITQILCHFSIPFPSSNHFSVMCAVDVVTVKRGKAQFRSRQSDSATPPSHSAPSRFAPSISASSSSLSDVSLGDIMAQLQCMDARLDTHSTEMYQVNVCVGRIARRQATMGGFVHEASPPPPYVASDSEDEDGDDGDDDDASDDDDGDTNFTDKMST